MRSRSSASVRFFAVTSTLALAACALGCPGRGPVAPTYEHRGGGPISDDELPLATASFAYAPQRGAVRKDLARPLADRLLQRSARLFARGREGQGLASVRIAAMLLRTQQIAASELSNEAVAALEAAVDGPAGRGEEGPSYGLYAFWSLARPNDPRPKGHLDNLGAWDAPQPDGGFVINAARDARRRSDALAYEPTIDDGPAADAALYRWMDGVVLFKDREGQRGLERYGDEAYAAVTGYRQAGLRLAAAHLRDGDFEGAISAINDPKAEGFVPEDLRQALDNGTSASAYHELIGICLKYTKVEGLAEPLGDAVLGVGLAGTSEHPNDEALAEVTARSFLVAGEGDVAPAILSRAIVGTKDEERRPGTKELGRALAVVAAAISDFGDREDWGGARRAYSNAAPILATAEAVGGVSPQVAAVRTLIGFLEAQAGRPAIARPLFQAAIKAEPNAAAYAGLAELDAREGKLAEARAWLDKALAVEGLGGDAGLHADVLAEAGDLARRAGDAGKARELYRRALRVLLPLRAASRGSISADVSRRIAAILSHFEGMADKEAAYTSAAESAANDPRLLAWVVRQRFLRPLRTVDVKRAHAAFERSVELGVRGLDALEVAVMARAIERRSGLAADGDADKLLKALATKDDAAGKIAKAVLDGGDLAALAGGFDDAHAILAARLANALLRWGAAGPAGARAELTAVVNDEHVGSLESDLAAEALEPTLAIPGVITAEEVPSL